MENLFGNIVNTIDQQRNDLTHSSLPENQRKALILFLKDLSNVAESHFSAYISGIILEPTVTAPGENERRLSSQPATTTHTYAGAAHRAAQAPPPQTKSARGSQTLLINSPHPSATNKQHQRPDDRLFARIPEGDKRRNLSAYAIQTHLESKLDPSSPILTKVQATKTGFALCPKTGESTALKEKIASVDFIGDAIIESATPWMFFRIENVPRTFGAINDNLEYCLRPVTPEDIHEALSTATGVSPVAVLPSQNNDAHPSSSATSWIVHFSESHQRLPRVLYLFGCRTVIKLLPRRQSIIQCTYWNIIV